MNNLSKSAMLVSVTIINAGLLGERRDAKASELVENTYNISHRRARATKYLIDRTHKSVKQLVSASQRVRNVVYRYTLPWGDETLRLLAVKTADEFREKLAIALDELEDARAAYLNQYPALVAASERDLGDLFDRSQYPTVEQVKEMFKSRVAYWPVPESNHFIAAISEEAAKEAKSSIEAEIEQRLIDATYDMVHRAKKVVEKFIEKLENVSMKENGQLRSVIRDSLTDNLKDTADLIERMNLTDNTQIKKVVKDLRRLSGFSARWIRNTGSRSGSNTSFESLKTNALKEASKVVMNLTMLDLKDQEVADMVEDAGAYMDM